MLWKHKECAIDTYFRKNTVRKWLSESHRFSKAIMIHKPPEQQGINKTLLTVAGAILLFLLFRKDHFAKFCFHFLRNRQHFRIGEFLNEQRTTRVRWTCRRLSQHSKTDVYTNYRTGVSNWNCSEGKWRLKKLPEGLILTLTQQWW